MERAVLRVTLGGLLLALVTTLPNKDDWDIYSFHINSTVSSRYATTIITSRVANRMEEAKEIEFHVRIPKNAFISKFRMFIDGQPYDGVVKAKEAAQRQYTDAVSSGQSAGIVSSVGRSLEEFKTSVNVAAHKKVTFELTYEELLKRRHGKYELQIHARPMQPVKDFKVDVHINEKAGINLLEIKGGLSADVMATAISKTLANKQAWVYFYPTEDQQKTCANCGDQGMNGDLVIVYDVNRDSSFGDIKKSGGYFVHHFAPSNLPRIPKNVVFVIDRSGSMHGRKIMQTRIALIRILHDLKEDDRFGIVIFDSRIDHWKRELVQANAENLESAKLFARRIEDRGSTDINSAVLEGSRMLNANPREGSASILILLTDGDPTSGVTNINKIQSNVREAIAEKFPLYCLGFGFDVNFEFLEKMSLQNNGVARRIYEDSDADLQLQGFYEEVATPLLTDITMIYEGGANLTQTNFSQYYNGSEIVVAGQITDNNIETFMPQVVAISRRRKVVFSNPNSTMEPTDTADSHIQRVWAYLTVKQLLDKELKLSGPEKKEAKKEALELSLKYSFVTPHTSMVVTKPQGEATDVLNKPKEGEAPRAEHRFVAASPPRPRGSLLYHGLQHSNGYRRGFGGGLTGGYGGDIGFAGLPGAPGPVGSPIVEDQAEGDMKISNTMLRHKGGSDYLLARTTPRLPRPTMIHPTIPHLVRHRFLQRTENQSTPLCYDIFGIIPLRLLHDEELSVNGELDSSTNNGFRKIFIHNNDQHLEITLTGVTIQNGQELRLNMGHNDIDSGSITVLHRKDEIDVTVGDVRIVILTHKKETEKFYWPALRHRPSNRNFTGILAQKPAEYEEIQQTPLTKLKIREHEVPVTRDSAVDYSVTPPPTLDCWLVPSEYVLQRDQDDVFITQL